MVRPEVWNGVRIRFAAAVAVGSFISTTAVLGCGSGEERDQRSRGTEPASASRGSATSPATTAAAVRGCRAGLVDTDFGVAGWAMPAGAGEIGEAAAVAEDGSIFLVGAERSGARRVLVRLTADGAGDAHFRPVSVWHPRRLVQVSRMITDRAGRLLLAATAGRNLLRGSPVVLRRLPDGRADPRFGKGGSVVLAAADGVRTGTFRTVSVDRRGRVIAAGGVGADMLVARLTGNGRLDPAFGQGGVVVLPGGIPRARAEARHVQVRSDGTLTVAGDVVAPVDAYDDRSAAVIARLDASGDVISRTDIAIDGAAVSLDLAAAAFDPRGGGWLAGSAQWNGMALLRLRRSGEPKASFGRGGHRVVTLRGRREDTEVAAVAPRRGGGVIVVGTVEREVIRTMPNGDESGEEVASPVAIAIDERGRPMRSRCSSLVPPPPESDARLTGGEATARGLTLTGSVRRGSRFYAAVLRIRP